MSHTAPRIVIAGAGHAGGSAAAFLRQYGWKGEILLVGEEALPPYQRPPLSKAWLKGEATAESLALRPAHFYEKQSIALRLSTRVTAIDRAAKTVTLSDGEAVGYDHLILALGARARALPIPGHDLAGVLALRGTRDADALQAALRPGARIAIIGGGYIGLEVAASARALGAGATVIERERRVLARVAGQDLSAITGVDGHATGVQLKDGRVIPADIVLVGVGALPNEELAREAGLACENGVVVDLAARTADPAIFAIGDCTRRPLPLYDRMGRLESVPNAIEQAKQAAAAICGRPAPPAEVPWFWSDQYDLRLQMAGLAFDTVTAVVRGDPAASSFAVFHLDAAGRAMAVEAVNAPADFMAGRLIVAKQSVVSPEALRDPAQDLKALAT